MKTVTKTTDFKALHTYLAAAAGKPFVFGGYDCVRFVAEALLVGWDRNYLGALGYDSRRSAVVRLRRADGLRDACTDALGDECLTADLVPGDVAYFETPAATIGLVLPGCVVIKSGRTIHRVDVSAAMTGWHT